METLTYDSRFPNATATARAGTRRATWVGRVLSGLAVLFLLFDSLGKLLQIQPVIDGALALGYPRDAVFGLGVVLLSCVCVYLVPRTALLGAVLLTGYLGGAVATHVRVGDPLFTHTLFPTYIAALFWGGLILRDTRLHELLPWARGANVRRRRAS